MKQINKHPRPSITRLRELFDYDPETGLLTRKPRPPEDFTSLRMWRIWQANNLKAPVGDTGTRGYRRFGLVVDGQRYGLQAHRVIWAIVHGTWPDEIDHRNGDHDDNRLENLRDASRMQNMQNMHPRRKGYSLDKRRGDYRVEIWVMGKRMYIGTFSTPEAAREAYLKAKAQLHTFQPVPRDE